MKLDPTELLELLRMSDAIRRAAAETLAKLLADDDEPAERPVDIDWE